MRPSPSFWIILAAVLFSFYLLTYSGGLHSIDEISTLAMTESIVKHGNLTVEQMRWSASWTPPQNNEGPDGNYYSKRGVALSLIAAPLYWVSLGWPGAGLVQGTMITGAILMAMSGALLASILVHLGYSRRVALTVAVIFAIATPAWPYSRTLYGETAVTCLWLLAFLAILRARESSGWALLGGLVLGASILVKPSNALGAGIIAFWALLSIFAGPGRASIRNRPSILFGLALLVSFGLLAVVNWLRFGSPLSSGYGDEGEGFVFNYATSLPALLVGPGKGLFVFAPPLIIALWGLRSFWRRQRDITLLIAELGIGNLLLYGAWAMWWGGWSWGPRFLVPVIPFLLLPLAELLVRPRRAIVFLIALTALAGTFVNALGSIVDFNEYLATLLRSGITDLEMIWAPNLWPPLGHLDLLRKGVVDVLWLSRGTALAPMMLGLLIAAGLIGLRLTHREKLTARAGLGLGVGLLMASAVIVMAETGAAKGTEADLALQKTSQTISSLAGRDDVVLLDLMPWGPDEYYPLIGRWMNHYAANPPYTALLRDEAKPRLLERLATHRRIWLVMPRTPPAPAETASDVERWWAERAAILDERWIGDLRVVRFVTVPAERATDGQVVAVLDNAVELLTPSVIQSDGLVLVKLSWRAIHVLDHDVRAFVQLIGPDGQLAGWHDRMPVSGFSPSSTWQPGQVIVDRYALPLPNQARELHVVAGLYDPSTGTRLLVSGGGDFIDLGTVPP